ncbi:MAG: hypothetical protein IPM56_12875 [Ignavibacteriales bacterium]|nr:MAG: hypothetical protein IPM56_12875 [Ignavibacteriales bacterium]
MSLGQIKSTAKSGKEFLTVHGEKTNFKLLDFWIWTASDIVSNAIRGKFAEFIVGTAVGINFDNVRTEWDAFDLLTPDGKKIEVKSSSYLQSWCQKKFSSILFSIKPARYWDASTNIQEISPKRHADVYVFCLLKHKVQETLDPLKMEQWDFYVLPTFKLDLHKKSESSITLNSLKKLTSSVNYHDLRIEIDNAYHIQQSYKESD